MASKLDYNATAKDAAALLSAHKEMLIAIAGVFFVLPLIAFDMFLAEEVAALSAGAQGDEAAARELLSRIWWVFMVLAVVGAIGTVAIHALLLNPKRPTVGGALAIALGLVLTYLVVQLLTGLVIVAGFFLLILPGLYLVARFTTLGPVLGAEEVRNPIAAIGRAWAITRGNGFSVLGLFLLALVVGLVVLLVATLILGILIAVVLPNDIGQLVGSLVGAILNAAFTIAFIILHAAIYRQLTARPASVPAASA